MVESGRIDSHGLKAVVLFSSLKVRFIHTINAVVFSLRIGFSKAGKAVVRRSYFESPYLVGFFLLLGILLRIYFIFLRKYPPADEIWAYLLTKVDFKSIWIGTLSDFHAPLYFLLLRAASVISPFGLNMFSIRLISVFFGLLGNLAIWHLGTTVLGKKRGLLVFYLSLFLPGFIWASIYGRYYSFLILLTTVSAIFFLRFLQRGDYWSLLVLSFISTIGIFTHYYFFLIDAGFLVFLVFTKKYRYLLTKWLLALSLTAIFCFPLLFALLTFPKPEIIGRLYNDILKIPAILITDITSFEVLLYLFYEVRTVVYLPVIILLWASSLLLLIYAIFDWKDRMRNLFLYIFFIPPAILLVVSYVYKPLLALGSFIIFLPALVILVGKGIDFRARLRGIISAIFLTSALFSLMYIFQSSAMYAIPRKDFTLVKDNLRSDDIVVNGHFYSYLMSVYYLGEDASYGVYDKETSTAPTQKILGYKLVNAEFLRNFRHRVWYLEPYYGTTNEAYEIKQELDNNFKLVRKEIFDPEKKYKENFEFFNVYLYFPSNLSNF